MRIFRVFFCALLLSPSSWAEPLPAVLHYTVQESFEVGGNVNVRSLLVDNATNSLWVGSSVGVLQVDLHSRDIIKTYTREQGLANEYVFALFKGQQGDYWFGTNGGGATRFYDGQWKTYFPMHGLADYWVYAFNQQADGTLWIGTWNGANRMDAKTGELTTYVDDLINEWVYALDVDSQDRVWFGTEGGVSMFDGETWQEWSHQEGVGANNDAQLSNSPNTGLGTRHRHNLKVMVSGADSYNENYVFSLLASADDTIWAGTWGGGVSHFNPTKDKRWKNLTQKDGLAGNIVYSIAQGKDGVLWFGTDHGLSRYDGVSWENYGMKEGLLGASVYTVAVTNDNHVWVGTRRGVAHLSLRP